MSDQREERIFLSDAEKRNATAILADPLSLDIYDSKEMNLARTMLAQLEPALIAIAAQGGIDESLHAGRILLGVGAASGLPLILEGLRRGDLKQQKIALINISSSSLKTDGVLHDGLTETVAAIRSLLKSTNAHLRELAAKALINATDSAPEELRALMGYGDPKLQQLGALELAKRSADPEAWQVIKVLFAWTPRDHYHDRYGLVHVLGEFAASSDPHLREDVAHLIRGELMALARRSDDNYADNEVMTLLEALKMFAPRWEMESLETVFTSKLGWSRGLALRRICELAGASALPRVLAAIEDVEIADHALDSIVADPENFGGDGVVAHLVGLLATAEGQVRRSKIAQTLVSLGRGEHPQVIASGETVGPWLRWEILTHKLGLDFDALANHLAEAGFPTGDTAEARQHWEKGDRENALLHLMAQRLYGFDAEDSQVPPDYPGLVMSLAKRGSFPVTSARLYDRSDRYELDVEMASATVTFSLNKQGDWIDVPGLLNGLNGLLISINSSLQYHALSTAGQAALIVLADTQGIARLVRDLAFPIGEAGGAAARGQAYERYVRSLGS